MLTRCIISIDEETHRNNLQGGPTPPNVPGPNSESEIRQAVFEVARFAAIGRAPPAEPLRIVRQAVSSAQSAAVALQPAVVPPQPAATAVRLISSMARSGALEARSVPSAAQPTAPVVGLSTSVGRTFALRTATPPRHHPIIRVAAAVLRLIDSVAATATAERQFSEVAESSTPVAPAPVSEATRSASVATATATESILQGLTSQPSLALPSTANRDDNRQNNWSRLPVQDAIRALDVPVLQRHRVDARNSNSLSPQTAGPASSGPTPQPLVHSRNGTEPVRSFRLGQATVEQQSPTDYQARHLLRSGSLPALATRRDRVGPDARPRQSEDEMQLLNQVMELFTRPRSETGVNSRRMSGSSSGSNGHPVHTGSHEIVIVDSPEPDEFIDDDLEILYESSEAVV